MKRIFALDVIRAVAIIGVIVQHVIDPFLFYAYQEQTFVSWIVLTLYSLSRVAVPLFILLSGALHLSEKYQGSIGNFYIKKIKRIFLPTLIFTFLFFYVQSVWRELSVMEIISEFIFLRIGSYYYLWILVMLYLFTPYINKIFYALHTRQRVFVSIGLFVFSICTTFFINFNTSISIYVVNIFVYWTMFLAYFWTGPLLMTSNFKAVNRNVQLAFFIVSTVFCAGATAMCFDNKIALYPADHLSIFIVIMSLTGFALLLKTKVFSAISYTVNQISSLSFSLYLIQQPVFTILFVGLFFLVKDLPMLLKLFIFFSLTFIVSTGIIFIWRFVKRKFFRI